MSHVLCLHLQLHNMMIESFAGCDGRRMVDSLCLRTLVMTMKYVILVMVVDADCMPCRDLEGVVAEERQSVGD